MAQWKRRMNSDTTVKTHHALESIYEQDFNKRGAEVLANADQGVQTVILAKDGRVRSVIGLNGTRYLPDPDPDPLDEILSLALQAKAAGK